MYEIEFNYRILEISFGINLKEWVGIFCYFNLYYNEKWSVNDFRVFIFFCCFKIAVRNDLFYRELMSEN